MSLGERLIELRKNKKLSQEEVAEKLGVSRQTISKWELDQSLPDFDKILPLCKLYNITSDELLTGKTKDKEVNNNDDLDMNIKKQKGKTISISVFLFILSLVWVIIGDSLKFISDEILVSIFLIIVAIGVVNIIYNFSKLPETDEIKKEKIKNKHKEKYDGVLAIIFTAIYLIVSFVTKAWHITWIIWIIYASVCEIIHLIIGDDDSANK